MSKLTPAQRTLRARKAAFTKALIELQVTLNIVRSNDPAITTDTWLRFADQYST